MSTGDNTMYMDFPFKLKHRIIIKLQWQKVYLPEQYKQI